VVAGPEETKNLAGRVLRLIQIRYDGEFEEVHWPRQDNLAFQWFRNHAT
jgi:hypothetical protein